MSNEIAVQDTPQTRRVRAFSSIQGGDIETRKSLFSALSNAKPLQENTGVAINVQHIVIVPVDVTDDITGEVSTVARTVLVADTGEAFAATSRGIDNSVQQIISVFGEPQTWDEPIAFVASREGDGKNKYLTLRLAE